jgi:dihydroorotate dehydrogenase
MADIQRLLRHLDPERAHELTVRLSQAAGAVPPMGWLVKRLWGVAAQEPVTVMGISFANRLGIAAGFDKDALALRGLSRLGVGHVEVGTVTPLPQRGNDRPRVFRLPEDSSIINRMGFPSRGADFVARRLRRPVATRVGVNLGKARGTPLPDATADYVALVERFAPLADYLTINVSSPNTPGLRDLQHGDHLGELLGAVAAARGAVPVLAKLSPDLDDAQLDDALAAVVGSGIEGVVATNTTTRRSGLTSSRAGEPGGLSGAGLTKISTRLVSEIRSRSGGSLAIIASGGVMNGADAAAKIDAGADLVQAYSGLVYRGPGLLRELATATR